MKFQTKLKYVSNVTCQNDKLKRHTSILKTLFRTLEALDTPQMKSDQYSFIFHRLTVVLLLEKGAHSENVHVFCIAS